MWIRCIDSQFCRYDVRAPLELQPLAQREHSLVDRRPLGRSTHRLALVLTSPKLPEGLLSLRAGQPVGRAGHALRADPAIQPPAVGGSPGT
jgi:hypothetical protein